MVECICINDKNRHKEIPANKWVKQGEHYTVIYTVTVLPQKQLAFHLAEIELDESNLPYEYFLANRFAFTEENLQKLIELIKDCNDTDFSMEELLNAVEKQLEILDDGTIQRIDKGQSHKEASLYGGSALRVIII
jgi:hypothetical protein